nr:HPP family protein [Pseudochelatococcus lubricantis]
MASFGASCVLVLTLPQSPLAQPRNVIGGHILSAAAGLLSLSVFGQTPLSMAAGVGLAIFAMAVTATLHPPGAGNPVIVIGGGYGLWYLVTPVATGAVVIVAFALLYHRLVSGHIYPVRKV